MNTKIKIKASIQNRSKNPVKNSREFWLRISFKLQSVFISEITPESIEGIYPRNNETLTISLPKATN